MDREIERYKREREEEMRKDQEGMRRALSKQLHHFWLWLGALSSLMPSHG
jgi:hypothetical protein